MNTFKCWYCEIVFEYDGEQYRDVFCPECGVQNSIYNPKEDSMKPQKRNTDYEKVVVGEFVVGVIEKIDYDNEHKFKGFQGKEDTVEPAVRLVFKLDGYKFPHYTRWMRFLYAEKANLYKKYISKLVENAAPDMEFDLDQLVGMRIKTIWAEENDFQSVDSIFPEIKKVVPGFTSTGEEWLNETTHEDEPAG